MFAQIATGLTATVIFGVPITKITVVGWDVFAQLATGLRATVIFGAPADVKVHTIVGSSPRRWDSRAHGR